MKEDVDKALQDLADSIEVLAAALSCVERKLINLTAEIEAVE